MCHLAYNQWRDAVEEMWEIILTKVTDKVFRIFIQRIEETIDVQDKNIKVFLNPYLYDDSVLSKISFTALERFKVRNNYMQVFNNMVVKAGKVPNMARAFFSYLISMWIRGNSAVSKDSVDRAMFFVSWCKYFISLAINKKLQEEISMKELTDHAYGFELLPMCKDLSAEEIALKIIEEDFLLENYLSN